MKFPTPILLALFLVMAAPAVHAGTSSSPEITDPADDSVSSQAPLSAGSVEITAGWIAEERIDAFTFKLVVGGDFTPDPTETLAYEWTLELDGTPYTFGAELMNQGADTPITPTGVASDASHDGAGTLTVVVPRDAFVDIAPGQRMDAMYVTATAYVGSPTVWNHADEAVNQRPYLVGKQAEATMDHDGDGISDADELAQGSDPTDPASPPAEEPEPVDEEPGHNETASEEHAHGNETNNETASEGEHAHGNHTAGENATHNQTGNETLDSTDGSSDRKVLAGLGFLTPVAEIMQLDGALGQYAEAAVLGILILVLILVVILLMVAFTRGSPVMLSIEPRKVAVAPGETASFGLGFANRDNAPHGVRATFSGPEWVRDIQVAPEGQTSVNLRSPGSAATFDLAAKGEPGAMGTGTVKVQVPKDTEGKERASFDVTFTPLGADGEPVAKKARTVHAQVAALDESRGAKGGLSIESVTHEPAVPRPGQQVLTSSRIMNRDGDDARLRVTLLVDGEARQTETITVRAHGETTAVFPWTADAGRNNVKIQVFPA